MRRPADRMRTDALPMQQTVAAAHNARVHSGLTPTDDNGSGQQDDSAARKPRGDPLREFSLSDFCRITPDLSGAERLGLFIGLPVDLQREAWRELSSRIDRQSRARFAEERLGGWCTAGELAKEIALIWREECAKVPLGGGRAASPEGRKRTSRIPNDRDDLSVLRSIPGSEYVSLLTGREVTRAGFVQCPLHGGGQERTPSLHVSADDGRWYCFGCDQGGGLLDFYAALHGRQVPRAGVEFVEFVRDVAGAIIGAGGKC